MFSKLYVIFLLFFLTFFFCHLDNVSSLGYRYIYNCMYLCIYMRVCVYRIFTLCINILHFVRFAPWSKFEATTDFFFYTLLPKLSPRYVNSSPCRLCRGCNSFFESYFLFNLSLRNKYIYEIPDILASTTNRQSTHPNIYIPYGKPYYKAS